MIYDVAIIGSGVTGAATAWQLSRYKCKSVLIEKCADVGFGISKANSGIVHGGFHHATTSLKAKLEIRGNLMFDKLHYELGFPYQKCGILVVAFSEEEMVTVSKLYNQGLANGVKNLEMCSRERILQLEPKINGDVVGGFFCAGGGTVEPYRYVFSLVETAMRNGVALQTNYEVTQANFRDGYWEIKNPDKEVIKARYVVNAAGLFADRVSQVFGGEEFTITPRKGEEYLLDRVSKARPNCVVFPVPSKHSKGVLVIPTAGGTTMIGPTAEMIDDKDDTSTTSENMQKIFSQVKAMISEVSPRDLITAFAGLRPVMEGDDFYIAQSQKCPNFIQAAGIQSPGLTASPAIGEYIKDLLKNAGVELVEKNCIINELSPCHTVREDSFEIIARLAKDDPAWANIVCRCEKISEAEIIEAVRKGHTTVDGIKFYTRATMGKCQGGFCTAKIMKIISDETGIPLEQLTKNGKNSPLAVGKLGDLTVLGDF